MKRSERLQKLENYLLMCNGHLYRYSKTKRENVKQSVLKYILREKDFYAQFAQILMTHPTKGYTLDKGIAILLLW